MALLDVMQEYFRGERAAGFLALVLGLLALAFAFWTVRSNEGGFGFGLLVPLLLLGLAGSIGGPALVIRTDRQVAELSAMSADQIRAIERPRMQKVNANWPRLKAAWTILMAIGLVLLWTVKRDWVTGLSLGLLLMTSSLFVLDVFAERRASIYTRALEQ